MVTNVIRRTVGGCSVLAAALGGLVCVGDSAWAQCGAPPNAIVAENCLTGSPRAEWDLSGAGDPTIQGYSTDISVNVGQTISFKINTDAASYSINIYRLGYYGGLGARKVATITPSASLPQTQPACLTDVSTRLVDCGNWALSASWNVPANATSGIYLALLRRSDTGGVSQIVFIVRKDASTSMLLFQTSDTTWQAYNNYGGYSLYVGPPAYKVSYNRPNIVRGSTPVTSLFDAEYPMLRWLEANGYDVTYFTGVDSVRAGQLIKNHKVYLSVGHDEYWSGPQRTNVEAARTAGVHLAFFSGNEVFWKTRWENSIDGSNTPNRTLVCYKETGPGAKIDPTTTWTGTWRDPRFSPPSDGGRPENGLTGTIFMVNGPDFRSIEVPAADGKMRFWRHTSIASLTAGDTAVLPSGTLGVEWDIDADNGFRPAGLIHLSTSTYSPTGHYLLDYGTTYGNGTATHSLTQYRAPSGALVFGAGTTRWSWGLDNTHDNEAVPTDVRMQQATVNLLADMGVQPGSIQPGLQVATDSVDKTSPTATITSPSPGSTATVGAPVTISGSATDAGGGVVAGIEVSTDGGSSWHPATGRQTWTYVWTPLSTGSTSLQARATDDSLNTQSSPSIVMVTVVGSGSSIFGAATPPDGGDSSAAELGLKFRSDISGSVTGVRFYKTIFNTGIHIGHLWSATGTLLGTATFAGESASGWQQANFSAPIPIAANTTYVVSYLAPNGHYAYGSNYFTNGVDNAPLHALANGFDGPNSVFIYNSAGGFPYLGGNGANYWVDLTFADNVAPVISGVSATVTPTTATITWATNEPSTSKVIYGTLPNSLLQNSTNASLVTAHSIPLTALSTGTTYYYRVISADSSGNTTTSPPTTSSPATFIPADTVPPVITAVAAAPGTSTAAITWTTDTSSTSRVDYGISPASLTQNASSATLVTSHSINLSGLAAATTYYYRVTSVDNAGNSATSPATTLPPNTFSTIDPNPPVITSVAAIPGLGGTAAVTWTTNNPSTSRIDYGTTSTALTLNVSNPSLVTAHSLSLTGLAQGTTYYYRVTSVDSQGHSSGSPVAPATATFVQNAFSLWAPTVVPGVVDGGDPGALEIGVKLRSDVAGSVTGVRFYKAATNIGTHIGHLWTSAGTLLGSATFANESASGWQQANFTSPIAVAANTTYVISYFAPSGHYSYNANYFASIGVDNAPLHGLANGVDGPNAVYLYGPSGGFPNFNGNSANYWVDLVFADNVAPSISAVNATTTPTAATITWSTDELSTSRVDFGTSPTALTQNSIISTLVTAHSIALTGLTTGTAYYYRVTSIDGYGNSATSPVTTLSPATFTPADTAPPVITAVTAVPGTSTASVTWTTDKNSTSRVDYGTSPASLTLNSSQGTLVTSHSVNLSGLSATTTYYYRLTSVDGSGNSATSPVTTNPPGSFATLDPNPPVISLVTAVAGIGGAATITWTTNNASTSRIDYGTTTASLTLNASDPALVTSHSLALTGLTQGTTYYYRVTSVDPLGHSTSSPAAPGTSSFVEDAFSLWAPTVVPGIVDGGDPGALEVGMRFRSDVAGSITGVRFYKAPTNAGTHIGNLWTNTGTLLGTVTFANETASGWQQANFATAVSIAANTTYVVSCYFPSGHYSVNSGFFGSGVDNPPLHGLVYGFDGPNGVYQYGSASAFPSSSYNSANYWVDVVFH